MSRYFLGKITFQGEAKLVSSEADGYLSLKTTVPGWGASMLVLVHGQSRWTRIVVRCAIAVVCWQAVFSLIRL